MKKINLSYVTIALLGGVLLSILGGQVGIPCGMAEPGGVNEGWKGLPLPYHSCGVWGESTDWLVLIPNFFVFFAIAYSLARRKYWIVAPVGTLFAVLVFVWSYGNLWPAERYAIIIFSLLLLSSVAAIISIRQKPRGSVIHILRGTLILNVLVSLGFLLSVLLLYRDSLSSAQVSIEYETDAPTESYREYRFDSGSDADMGFTRRALGYIAAQEVMPHEESQTVETVQSMSNVKPTESDRQRGVLEKYAFGEDIYELRSDDKKIITASYSIYRNDALLFTAHMDFGSDGPILDQRIIDGQPAFTYRTPCDVECGTNIFYNGFVSEEYDVTNPQYLFTYNEKIGFIAKDQEGYRIFFNGAFITPAFDSIHTHNCCALNEILPKVYSNAVLLFYGRRNDEHYLVEVVLEHRD